ncbi:unnamed protein product, partial [Amoebophrya sp. A120]|eukprot:GSA120T00019107001.1
MKPRETSTDTRHTSDGSSERSPDVATNTSQETPSPTLQQKKGSASVDEKSENTMRSAENHAARATPSTPGAAGQKNSNPLLPASPGGNWATRCAAGVGPASAVGPSSPAVPSPPPTYAAMLKNSTGGKGSGVFAVSPAKSAHSTYTTPLKTNMATATPKKSASASTTPTKSAATTPVTKTSGKSQKTPLSSTKSSAATTTQATPSSTTSRAPKQGKTPTTKQPQNNSVASCSATSKALPKDGSASGPLPQNEEKLQTGAEQQNEPRLQQEKLVPGEIQSAKAQSEKPAAAAPVSVYDGLEALPSPVQPIGECESRVSTLSSQSRKDEEHAVTANEGIVSSGGSNETAAGPGAAATGTTRGGSKAGTTDSKNLSSQENNSTTAAAGAAESSAESSEPLPVATGGQVLAKEDTRGQAVDKGSIHSTKAAQVHQQQGETIQIPSQSPPATEQPLAVKAIAVRQDAKGCSTSAPTNPPRQSQTSSAATAGIPCAESATPQQSNPNGPTAPTRISQSNLQQQLPVGGKTEAGAATGNKGSSMGPTAGTAAVAKNGGKPTTGKYFNTYPAPHYSNYYGKNNSNMMNINMNNSHVGNSGLAGGAATGKGLHNGGATPRHGTGAQQHLPGQHQSSAPAAHPHGNNSSYNQQQHQTAHSQRGGNTTTGGNHATATNAPHHGVDPSLQGSNNPAGGGASPSPHNLFGSSFPSSFSGFHRPHHPPHIGFGDTSLNKKDIVGQIRMFNPTKGWGFIVCADYNGDIFLHTKHIVRPQRINGQFVDSPQLALDYIGHFNHSSASEHRCMVRFDLDFSNERPQALNVRLQLENFHLMAAGKTDPVTVARAELLANAVASANGGPSARRKPFYEQWSKNHAFAAAHQAVNAAAGLNLQNAAGTAAAASALTMPGVAAGHLGGSVS